ncbi:endonuclease/exonuclease/phosphatase [Planctomycetota bacterium]
MEASRKVLITAVACLLSFACFADAEITIISWNVQSGDADPGVVANQMAAMSGVDLWGLSEVNDTTWAQSFEVGAETGEPGDFTAILGTTGNTDRLLILYDSHQFTEVANFEIGWANRPWYTSNMRPRSALVVRLRHNATNQEFFFMVNHLYRGSGVDPRRLDQARYLSEWTTQQTLPVIAVGDYNFDWDLDFNDSADNYNKGLGAMTAHGFDWLKPVHMVTTHDSHYNSVLDFVFLANYAGVISGTSEIVVRPNDFPDNNTTPDHRPVKAVLNIGPPTGQSQLRQQILDRIDQIEQELAQLRLQVQQLP